MRLKFLYKYRKLESYNKTNNSIILNNHTRNILEKGEIWFSKPSDFNDPFDCHLSFQNDFNEEDAYDFFLSKGISKKEIKNTIRSYKNDPIKIEQLKTIASQTDIFRIFCLSKTRDNILMWSHYSQNHSGICIGFKIYHYLNSICIQANLGQIQQYVSPEGLLPGISVTYTDDYPEPLNFFKRTPDNVKPFFLHKSKVWEYENEIRFFLMEHNYIYKNKPIIISQNEIGEIIFGVNTKKHLESEVLKIIENNKDLNPKIYKCSLNNTKYKLDLVDY